ncbi:MAG: hypothetical protein ABSB49_02745 [Polyangia bacterium]
MMGSDLWWHLAAGRWIWQTGTLNFRDPWSFTAQGQPWLNPEWLSDLIFHAWSSWLGLTSLVWWKWSALVGAFAILFGVLRRLSGSSPAAYVATLFAVAVGAPFFDVRPQLYAILGLAVVLRLALLPSRWRWLLPLVFFLWANLHSSFIFGLVALAGILVIARLCGQGTRNALPLWLACLVVGLLNPAGPDAYLFPVGFAAHSASAFTHIAEWRPPWYPGGIRSPLYYPALGTFALGVAATFSTKLHRRNGHLTFTGVALGLLTLAMSLRSRRFIPLFGVAQALVMAPVLGALAARLAQRARGHFPRFAHPYPWRLLAPALALALAAYHLLPYPLSSRAFLYLTSQDSFPVEAMNVIEANHLTGKVFAYYEWGGYLDLRSDGRLQVYIDGRAGTVFDELTYRDYTRVLGLTKGWEDIVTASGAEFFLWPRRHHQQVEGLRASGQWRLIYADHVATLLARADLPVPSPLLPSPASAWRELAGLGRLGCPQITRRRAALRARPDHDAQPTGGVRVAGQCPGPQRAHEPGRGHPRPLPEVLPRSLPPPGALGLVPQPRRGTSVIAPSAPRRPPPGHLQLSMFWRRARCASGISIVVLMEGRCFAQRGPASHRLRNTNSFCVP